jgi:hypothetical protein
MDTLARQFEDRGRRWAERMLARLQMHMLEIPLVWPGTPEQARTLVHAFTDESLPERDRDRFVEAVQNGARAAWRDLAAAA